MTMDCLLITLLISANLLTAFNLSSDSVRIVSKDEPEFVELMPNVTKVVLGRDAQIHCLINNLETYSVSWLRLESNTILTNSDQIVSRNYRINLNISDNKLWTLVIKNVQESDRGGYMCQINSVPIKVHIIYLEVIIPPDMIDSEISSDVMLSQNLNITLTCKAKGYPSQRLNESRGEIRKENWQQNFKYGIQYDAIYESERLTIFKVNRSQTSAFLCISERANLPSSSELTKLKFHCSFLDTVRYTIPSEEPEFVDQIPNVTVALGRDAKLPCIVNNLETYRVAWLRVESKTILTIHHHVITRNNRISLSQSDHKIWTLHIKSVQESDRGGYMCQINTMPAKSQVGYLDVTVPPDFVNAETSSDVMVRENLNVTLKCKAKGYPNPRLTWRREDSQPIEHGNWQQNKNQGMEYDTTLEGENLTIYKVSRLHMGAYLCIAQNGVPPSVSRRIVLQVHFPPMIWIPNQLIGASIGGEVTLDCNTEAFPLSLNYWTKEDNYMIVSSDKFKMSNSDKSYKVHMKLSIKNIEPSDFGTYRCYAKNSLGSTQGSIRLYEIHYSAAKEPSTARIQSLNDQVKLKKNDKQNDNFEDEDYNNKQNRASLQTMDDRKLQILFSLIFLVISHQLI